MLFNSYIFIFLFLPIVLIGYQLLRHQSSRWPIVWIILASLFYYGWWKPQFLLLLLFSIFVNLVFAKLIFQSIYNKNITKIILAIGISFNLGMLAYFKYAGFIVTNFNLIFNAGLPSPEVLLPIGISFITFQKIAFLVDAYRGNVRNFSILNYFFFVTFFPQLIAGPIVHHQEIMPQLHSKTFQTNCRDNLSIGLCIFILGLFKKVIIADSLSVYADAGYSMVKNGHALDMASAWITVFSYSFQIYFDFSAYSDMAIGLGRMFGIRLPLNFFSPYKASSIIEFWRRWHITLSRFLRDYLYFPLGGNRKGFIKRYFNLVIVMLLGGLWHGASWTFVAWGGAHGILLILNHAWRALPFAKHSFYKSKPIKLLNILLTFLLVTLAWIPFRSESMADVGKIFTFLFYQPFNGFQSFVLFFKTQLIHLGSIMEWFQPRELWPAVLSPDFLTGFKPLGLILFIVSFITFMMPNVSQLFNQFSPVINPESRFKKHEGIQSLTPKFACLFGLLFILSVLSLAHVSPFLYFQF